VRGHALGQDECTRMACEVVGSEEENSHAGPD
jgi:hypothetical protein